MSTDWIRQVGTYGVPDAVQRVERMTQVKLDPRAAHAVFVGTTPAKERLEFLGDRVLRLGATMCLLEFVTEPGAQLLEMLKVLVANDVCASHLVKYGLHRSILNPNLPSLSQDKRVKAAADTYEAVLAAIFLVDFDAGVRLAYENTREVLAQKDEVVPAAKAYVAQYTGRRRDARRNAGGARRPFDPAMLHEELHVLQDAIAPALGINTSDQERLQVLGEAVVKLATAWRIYDTAGLREPGVMEEAFKVLSNAGIYQALGLKYGLDRALWGKESDIADAVTSQRQMRAAYQAVIGVWWNRAPHREVVELVQRDLSTVPGATVRAMREAATKLMATLGKQVKQVEAVQILNMLAPSITAKAQGAVVDQYPLYEGPEVPDSDGRFTMDVALASGLVDPRLLRGFRAPSEVVYFVARGRGATRREAKEAAAGALLRWMVAQQLVRVTAEDAYTLNVGEYRERVRKLFNSGVLRRVFLAVEHRGVWGTVGGYAVAES